jgi:hypothetical protein
MRFLRFSSILCISRWMLATTEASQRRGARRPNGRKTKGPHRTNRLSPKRLLTGAGRNPFRGRWRRHNRTVTCIGGRRQQRFHASAVGGVLWRQITLLPRTPTPSINPLAGRSPIFQPASWGRCLSGCGGVSLILRLDVMRGFCLGWIQARMGGRRTRINLIDTIHLVLRMIDPLICV